MRKIVATLAALVAIAWIAIPSNAGAGAKGVFSAPLRLGPPQGHGYEPSVFIDHFGNIFVTAHKENYQLALWKDDNSPTFTRSMSWAWWSTDDGKTFKNIPGFPGDIEQHDFGDEGDMALDDANHLYFTDTNVADDTFTRWTISGRGKIAIDTHRPLMPAAEPVDDRPWVTAHGNGHVLYFGNEGGDEYSLGQGRKGNGNGSGRYTVYRSTDAGDTFDFTGYTLKDSGWCRPAAESNTKYVYAICTNDSDKLYAFVSADDGQTFSRYDVGSINPDDPYQSWPTVAIAPDGTIYALYIDAITTQAGAPTGNRLMLYRSSDHGRTWTGRDITTMAGRYEYNWLSISADGKTLGLSTYYRKNNRSPWYVYGALFKPNRKPRLIALDPAHPVQGKECAEAPGDYLGSAIGPDGKLSVVWTRNLMTYGQCGTLTDRDIYYARSL